ncbi:dipeptide ABC transporter ATP binding subunit DppD [Rhodovastum atsumiense]|uniref:ABC transporter ATP-binding protein n=1 Tax=Rhodovastum atsumiense TaxID=504468 RepID=A0A5M6IQV3_9PROT|nr:ABC transporter ATP-binding protein [Rhodovastum atsumiense]KAA5610664.1 ABC transporter ATP-binding protein [Rhodovastum atsumiense]CAH2603343.1 dipeptide ABC transporter ATP binding subunit DppD [Rhodovastum atsumiense]
MTPVLELRHLSVSLDTRAGPLRAVDDVSFAVEAGETLAVVGESGCGKSLTALAVMRLLPQPPARIGGGQVLLAGRDLLALPEREMRAARGRDVAMIFQDAMSALNPVLTVGAQIIEMIRAHQDLSTAAARRRACELLDLVGIPEAEARLDAFPHRLSGGMAQRVMIAMAIACNPRVLIADEPTTALDVTIQAQILDLLRRLQRETGMALLLITHDLGVVAEMADRVVVMYAGRKVEEAGVDALFGRPLHPYARGLMAATPAAGPAARHARLADIPGMVPALADLPPGCAFAARCPLAFDRCRREAPALRAPPGLHPVACFAVEKEVAGVAHQRA